MKAYHLPILVLGLIMLALTGCGGGGDGDEYYTCSYEKRVTDGCDGYGFGDWEAESFSFNADDYFIEPDQVCANVTTGGLACEADCCVDAEYRNIDLSSDISIDEWD